MGTTANYAFRWPTGSNAPNVPTDIKNLADDADTALKTVDNRVASIEGDYARGHVFTTGNVTTDSTTFGTTETMLWTATFTSAGNTRMYSMYINSGWSMNGGTATFRLRWAVGASVTTASTQIWVFRLAPQVTSGYNRLDVQCPVFSGLTAGQVTVGLSGLSDGPTDGRLIGATDNYRRWDIIDLGV